MKIAISTIWNDDFRDIAAITVPILTEYCLRHGYTLHAVHSDESSPEIVWQRLDGVTTLFSHHNCVVHMDADVLITNMTKTIEEIPGRQHWHIATSENGIINDGVFIWNTNKWVAFLSSEERFGDFSSPQDAINKTHGKFMDIHHVPPRTMNSVLNAEYGQTNELTEWQPGDFVLHLPGMGNPRRIEILKEYSQKIIR